jgi:hypothetical protein
MTQRAVAPFALTGVSKAEFTDKVQKEFTKDFAEILQVCATCVDIESVTTTTRRRLAAGITFDLVFYTKDTTAAASATAALKTVTKDKVEESITDAFTAAGATAPTTFTAVVPDGGIEAKTATYDAAPVNSAPASLARGALVAVAVAACAVAVAL